MVRFSGKMVGLLLGPLSFIVISNLNYISILSPDAWNVLGVGAWMVIWWITEATPIAISALLPIILFPALGVFNLTQATASYANPVVFLFLGGFLIALGLEEHGMHKRISLNLIKLTGSSANGIILGFMLATAFLSMWISNTAATILMLPIASTITSLLDEVVDEKRGLRFFSLSLMLGIAYSANIGGIATIIGTPPNLVLAGFAEELLRIDLDFATWMLIGVPIASILLLLSYFFLTQVLYPNKLGNIANAGHLIERELIKLGKMSKSEKLVLLIFSVTAIMWIFKTPINNILNREILNDTGTAIIGALLMFSVPVDFKKGIQLVPWEASKRLPWGIIILFGGGITLAKGMETTGLINLIADFVSHHKLSSVLVYLILISSMLFLTELMSNVALATIYIPLVIGIANGLSLDPLLMCIPMAMASSCAFMLPISTPPNAIVFSSGHISINQMIRAGFILNILSVLILMIASFTIIKWVFG
jgi:solute carrier family 13 (sodium-dependent dicarboxylate transporter), member 2/3/5